MISELMFIQIFIKLLLIEIIFSGDILLIHLDMVLKVNVRKVYALLCKGRQSGLALVNAPSMKDFKRSIEPSFVDDMVLLSLNILLLVVI